MDKHEFMARFRDDIRVRVDWQAFLSGPWQVRCERLQLPQSAERLWTPWYPNAADGPPAADPAAWPLSLNVAAANRHRLGRNEQTLDKHLAAWRDGERIEAPAFALPGDGFLLLDRNHRIVAGTMRGGQARLELAVIHGPLGATLLPDMPRFA